MRREKGKNMDSMRGRAAAATASLVLLAALAACGGRVENTNVPQEPQQQAGTEPNQTVVANNAPAAQEGYVHSLGAKGDTSVMDPDVLLSEEVKAALASSPDFGSSSKVDVHSADGDVTLRGRAPDPEARTRATDIARSIPNVKSVDNQLTLG
jgi:osmotically-inducible protein OsmY